MAMIVEKIEDDVYSFENFTEKDLDWKNFSCKKRGQYAAAYPNFDLYIPEELANELRDKNVKVKLTEPRDPGDEVKYRVNVKINFDYYKEPEVYILKNGREKEFYNADTVYIFDTKDIIYGEMVVKVNFNANSDRYNGLYANILGVKVLENPFDAKAAEQEAPVEMPFN